MLIGLTKTQQLKAGWLVALAYLFCVLAPTLSFALPGGHATPYCLTLGPTLQPAAGNVVKLTKR